MASTYIIHSSSLNKFYIGACQENVIQRLEKHNNHTYGKSAFTAVAKDWRLFLEFQCVDYSHAIRLERKIKAMKSKIYILNLKKYPELRIKIILETKNS